MFKMLKNQKGMTLVELLAVMVIVGIIAAISIPAIGGLLENTRKDAFVSSAVTLQESARLYFATYENEKVEGGTDNTLTITMTTELKEGKEVISWNRPDFVGYLENFVDPTTKADFKAASVTISKDKETGETTYTTMLEGSKYKIETAGDAKSFNRDSVVSVTK